MAKLGQHFLTDKHALEKIVSLLELKNDDFVLEIGPGHGELTKELRFKNNDLRIMAIEKDAELIRWLQKIFSGDKNIEFIEGDALKVLPYLIHKSKFLNHDYKICGNIPYYITGKLLRIIGELDKKPDITVLTIQKEVAERICAQPRMNLVRSRPRQQTSATGTSGRPASNGMNRLAASVQFWAEPKIAFILPRSVFYPAPKVDSATVVLKLTPPRKISDKNYYKIVRALFAQPRKTILNNVSGGMGISKKETAEKLGGIGIETSLRPQNLSIEDIIKIAGTF